MRISSFLTLLLFPLAQVPVWAQGYVSTAEHRAVFWSEQNFVIKTPGKWSFQLDHQYRRQAGDVNRRDLNIVRLPLQQVFRPWINYQISKPVKLSVSPVGLWWTWGRNSVEQPTTFFQEIRIIPQVAISQNVGPNELSYRFRTELRWPSNLDTLTSAYVFLSDGESQKVLADRFDVRLRGRFRWDRPIFTAESDWYAQGSMEPMAVLSTSGVRFDQNRTTLAVGRNLGDNLRLELGYLNQFSIRTNEAELTRLFRFNHALQVYLYLEIGGKTKVSTASDSDG